MTRSLLFLHARPGRGRELLRILEELGLLATTSDVHGLLEIDVATSVEDEDDVVIVGSWASPELYERWLAGPVPGRFLRELDGLLAAEPVSRVYRTVESVS